MKKILFICHGNICRSPMAEFIMKDKLKKRHLENAFYIESAGTSSEEIWGKKGNPVYPPAKKMLAKHGISCEGKRARQICRDDYDRFDYLIAMEDVNLRRMKPFFPDDPQKKIFKLLDFGGGGADIDDPWYTGDFEGVYKQIETGCEALIGYLVK